LTIDKSGRALLARLAAKGIRLRAAGMYTSHVVQDLVAASSSASGSPSPQKGTSRKKRASPKSESGHG
jgi:hypothetical protein